MIHIIVLLAWSVVIIDGRHFNGGSIRWEPVNPYDNSSSVTIFITQTYFWTYPTIECSTDVPISTNGRTDLNANLTCTANCSTDGGYSTKPVNILTDCVTLSPILGIMTSRRTVNATLDADAHFYISYMDAAWRGLNYPNTDNLQWSITSYIDLQKRSDGFMNTPPVANVISPQYAIVNRTTQIKIPVSDANAGDDVRCRWSTYTPGVNRRRRSIKERYRGHESVTTTRYNTMAKSENIHRIKKRWRNPTKDPCGGCSQECKKHCRCTCPQCLGTNCGADRCEPSRGQQVCFRTTTVSGATVPTTTVETRGTLSSTISYRERQAIDECGGICYPSSVPNGTTLSNCTISFTGLEANTWYGISVQVEDFINETSNVPMSSIPIQFLIYIQPEPFCIRPPVIVPINGCMEVTVNVAISFNVTVINNCNLSIAILADLVITHNIDGIQIDYLTESPIDASISYATFYWTPHSTQIGPQQLCMVAYTDEQLASDEYCVTFIVTHSLAPCVPTTSTTTTSTATTSTSATTTTTTTTTSTSTSTSVTSTTTTTTTAKPRKSDLQWLLIAGLSLLALLLALCCCCCYLYWWHWGNATRRRRLTDNPEVEPMHGRVFSRKWSPILAFTPRVHRMFGSNRPNEDDREFEVLSTSNSIDSVQSRNGIDHGSDPKCTSITFKTNMNRVSVIRLSNIEKPIEIGNRSIKSPSEENLEARKPSIGHVGVVVRRVSRVSNLTTTDENKELNPIATFRQPLKGRSMSLNETGRVSVIKLSRNRTIAARQTDPNTGDVNMLGEKTLNEIKSEPRRSETLNIGNVSVRKVKRSSVSVIST